MAAPYYTCEFCGAQCKVGKSCDCEIGPNDPPRDAVSEMTRKIMKKAAIQSIAGTIRLHAKRYDMDILEIFAEVEAILAAYEPSGSSVAEDEPA